MLYISAYIPVTGLSYIYGYIPTIYFRVFQGFTYICISFLPNHSSKSEFTWYPSYYVPSTFLVALVLSFLRYAAVIWSLYSCVFQFWRWYSWMIFFFTFTLDQGLRWLIFLFTFYFGVSVTETQPSLRVLLDSEKLVQTKVCGWSGFMVLALLVFTFIWWWYDLISTEFSSNFQYLKTWRG